jgi:hypothetical protein
MVGLPMPAARRLASFSMLDPMRWWLPLVLGLGLTLSCVRIQQDSGSGAHSIDASGTEVLRWPSLPVSYCLDLALDGYADDQTFTALVTRAFEAWGVAAQARGRCDGGLEEGDQRNEIGWGAPPVASANGAGVYESGFTRIRYRECGRNCHGADAELVEADIIVDKDAPRGFRSQRCFYSVLLHEVGHFLGLQHIPAPSVMAAVTASCPQAPTTADRQALTDLYGGDLSLR